MATDITKSARRRLAQAREHAKELLADIAEAGSRRQAESAQRLYLDSKDAIKVAAQEARKSFPRFRRPPVSVIEEMVGKVNVWQPCSERVMLRRKEKKTPGTYRLTYDFGPQNRIRHHLVAACLKPRVKLHPRQYASKGNGGTH